MKIEIENLTEAQAIALEDMLATWQWLGSAGASRWTAFLADGDGNFQPKIKIDGREPQKTTLINTKFPGVAGDNTNTIWKTVKVKVAANEFRDEYEVYMIDFDSIAWKLRELKTQSNGK